MIDFPVAALATYRLTKLVIDDEILREPRNVIMDRIQASSHPLAPKAYYFMTCPWCVSIWAAGGLLLLHKVSPNLAAVITTILAASGVSGVLAERVA